MILHQRSTDNAHRPILSTEIAHRSILSTEIAHRSILSTDVDHRSILSIDVAHCWAGPGNEARDHAKIWIHSNWVSEVETEHAMAQCCTDGGA